MAVLRSTPKVISVWTLVSWGWPFLLLREGLFLTEDPISFQDIKEGFVVHGHIVRRFMLARQRSTHEQVVGQEGIEELR